MDLGGAYVRTKSMPIWSWSSPSCSCVYCGVPWYSDLISAASEVEFRSEAAVVAGLRLGPKIWLPDPLNELPP